MGIFPSFLSVFTELSGTFTSDILELLGALLRRLANLLRFSSGSRTKFFSSFHGAGLRGLERITR